MSAGIAAKQDDPLEPILGWLIRYTTQPRFSEWKNRQILATLNYNVADEKNNVDPFNLDEKTLLEHSAVESYLNLLRALQDIRDTEYYFRRFPFRGVPITRSDHLRHMCELFFSKIYIFKERFKCSLNEINKLIGHQLDVSKAMKEFTKTFENDLKERNQIHHQTPYSDIELNQIRLLNTLLSVNGPDRQGSSIERMLYRRTSRGWVLRVRSRSEAAAKFVEALGSAMQQRCEFLK